MEEKLTTIITESDTSLQELEAEITQLQATVESLRATNSDLKATNSNLEATKVNLELTIQKQEATIALLRQRLFGRKSERRKKSTGKTAEADALPEELSQELAQEVESIKESTELRKRYLDTQELPGTTVEVESGRHDPSIEVEIVEIDTKPDDWSEAAYEELPPKITERLVAIPARLLLRRTIRRVWKRKDTQEIVPILPPPAHVFDRCSVDESLIVNIIIHRFLYHLPYYRQEKMYQLMGFSIS